MLTEKEAFSILSVLETGGANQIQQAPNAEGFVFDRMMQPADCGGAPSGWAPPKMETALKIFRMAAPLAEAIDHALREEKAFLRTLFAGKEYVAVRGRNPTVLILN